MSIKERWKRYKEIPDNLHERIEMLGNFFRQKGIPLAYLFGSAMRGKGNDVDIAVLYDGDISELRLEIQEILGTWRIDLVNLKVAPLHICFEIISTGKLVHKVDDETENNFEMLIIKKYQDSEPIRAKYFELLRRNLQIGI
ncbi:MAG: nucleotidyltransferase domain-containing protein [Candidatus Bathyarchaeia archaeon]